MPPKANPRRQPTARVRPKTRRKLRFVGGFGAYFAALWLLWNTPVVLPLKLFVVLLHEISHGLMAIASGGEIREIVVAANEGGLCNCPGGSRFLTLSAGYLGSLAWGAAILWLSLRGALVRRATTALIGAGIGIVAVLYLRNPFGVAFGMAVAASLLGAAWKLPPLGSRLLLTTLGLTSCLYAILDIKSDILDRPDALSDAAMLAEFTGVPTVVWGTLWVAIALGASWRLLRWAYRRA